MKIRFGYSPCPNDTFAFYALAHGKIDTQGLDFEIILDDVEGLNRRAFAQELELTKLSYHAFTHLRGTYALLRSGSALGRGCGPLVITRADFDPEKLPEARVAIPGRYTTANFLLGLRYPQLGERVPMLFSEIEDAVLDGRVDAGLIIHENRFTYAQRGLVSRCDLGDFWEKSTGLPIPLGCIAAHRRLSAEVQTKLEAAVAASVRYAFAHPDETMPYVRQHAQAMEESVMRQHIGLYVNEFTAALGADGEAAVQALFARAESLGFVPSSDLPLFAGMDAARV